MSSLSLLFAMHTAILGVQWGDEGKGKIVDSLTEEHDVVVRYGGGANAGHTVYVKNKEGITEKFVFHLVPSGVLHPNKVCVLGNGVVADPDSLAFELFSLPENHGQIYLSDRAHVVLPKHIEEDKAREKIKKIGTTQRGIGPCYRDKTYRDGVRFCDDEWKPFFNAHVQHFMQSLITDTGALLQKFIDNGNRLLFEGAQGVLLDVDLGTYPFVTSSNTGIGGVYSGSGVCPKDLKVVGVMKAYTTRVGEGPFPTESLLSTGNYLRENGGEFGSTTGRPRRCGWFDGVVARYAVRSNGVDEIALTKLDVLSGLDEILVCTCHDIRESSTPYKQGRIVNNSIPANASVFARIVPKYLAVEGWKEDISNVRKVQDLPRQARRYVDLLEDLAGKPITYIGVGQGREELIRVRK